jgi:histidyl-tRNA synthetase
MRKRWLIEDKMRDITQRWGYEEIKTPVFEHLDLFTMKSGEEIKKEIYTFKDKSGRDMALRPELTAPVMRMYVNELKMSPKPLRFYYFENCFRYERPQKNRFREFWQFGVEVIGGGVEAEAEVIALASKIVEELGVKARLSIGHLGAIRHLLGCIDEDERRNILRLIDKKDEIGVRESLDDIGFSDVNSLFDVMHARSIDDAREVIGENECLDQLEQVLEIVDHYGVDYTIDFGIARGLEYYTGVVFEIYADELAQSQVCGGGSYRLSSLFGGPDVPSTGFAFGFDRFVDASNIRPPDQTMVVVASTDDARKYAIEIALRLREYVTAYLDVMQRGLSDQLSFANTINASFAVILGKKELEEEKVTLKDMRTKEQEMIDLDECINRIKKTL